MFKIDSKKDMDMLHEALSEGFIFLMLFVLNLLFFHRVDTREIRAEGAVDMQRKGNRMSFQFDQDVERSQLRSQRGYSEEGEARGTSPGLPLSHFQNRRKRNTWPIEVEAIRDTRPSLVKRLKRSSKVFIVAGAAIGVGILLGMMVLSIFSNLGQKGQTQLPGGTYSNKPPQQGQDSFPVDSSNKEETSDQVTESDGDTRLLIPSENVQDGTVQLSARSYFVVQAGVFSDLTAAREVKQKHISGGWAGWLLENSAPYRFYTGLSTTKEDATLIGRYYQEQGVEVYVKEHMTSEQIEARIESDDDSLKLFPSFLTKGDQLLAKLGEISSRGIMNEEYMLSLAEWNELKELHRVFLLEGQQVFATWTENEKTFGEQMMLQMTTGVNALEEFRKQNHVTYLWRVQQASLDYVHQYEQMVTKLGKK